MMTFLSIYLFIWEGPLWQSGNTLASHLWGRGSVPSTASIGKASSCLPLNFIYLGFYVAFNTVQVISWRVVGRAEETSTYSSLGFCTVNCRPMASNYQLSHLRPWQGSNPGLRGGRRECYHSATMAPTFLSKLST